ncbi:MAG: hypothetical protein WD066_15650 [Planctomycetaceae bacterium]
MINGEQDLRRFFAVAERIGGDVGELEQTDAAELLPGTVDEVIGRRIELFLPDYWLFVVHHLGWTGLLPYACKVQWKHGRTFADESFGAVSRLPVNVVQASIDALTVLIDAVPGTDHDQAADESTEHDDAAAPASTVEDSTSTAVLQRRTMAASQMRKRATRAGAIEALRKELIEHIHAARDHARAAMDCGRTAELLPQPSQSDLARRVGITRSAASRCFLDRNARELNLLWETAGDLDAILQFSRR